MEKATLRLFNAIHVNEKTEEVQTNEKVLKHTIKNGYILEPSLYLWASEERLRIIEEIVGISGIKANATFHKSWKTIQDSSMEDLVTQQIMHYITTYGFDALGIYSDSTIYIPDEVLELPEINMDKLPLTVIKAVTSEELLELIIRLGSGIALMQETLDDIMVIVKELKFHYNFVDKIENRELKSMINDLYNIVPEEPVAFLRHIISKLTDESLIIKNRYLIDKIKESNGKFLDTLMKDAPKNLASIFLRYKPLFLAMRSISNNKTVFNQLRRKANTMHKPLGEDYLNSITAQIKEGSINFLKLESRLKETSIFRKIRLAYALNYRINSNDSIVYRVRNGKGWVTDFKWYEALSKSTDKALKIVMDSIIEDISKNVSGEVIYIPSNIGYALPATEKQFIGNMPTGSYATVPEDLIVGIHWENTEHVVDLDLSVISESGKIGWDVCYRSEGNDVLFSGDITSAPKPKGATELFYIKGISHEAKLLVVNYYNFSKGDEVNCKVLVAQEKPENFGANYMVDISNIVATANINITKKMNILGLITHVDGENRVYFANSSIGNAITSSANEQSTNIRKYLIGSLVDSLDFNDILKKAGAIVVNERPECNDEGEPIEYINLSPEALDKTTIIDLISSE